MDDDNDEDKRWQRVSKFVLVVQKQLGMNKFVRTKSFFWFFSVASDGATTERQI